MFGHYQPDYDGMRRGPEDRQDVKPTTVYGILSLDSHEYLEKSVRLPYILTNPQPVGAPWEDEFDTMREASQCHFLTSGQWTDGVEYAAACALDC